ncbi:hypothetical protein Hanom_Chr10g00881011 [Helianthus anomalus]
MAISLSIEMLCNSVVDLDNLIYPSVFKVYAELGLCKNGAQLHGRVLKLGLLFDDYICNNIVHMYANYGGF